MAIRCPHCNVQVPLNPSRSNGSVYTAGGVVVKGALDINSGIVMPHGGTPLQVYYPLVGNAYMIASCADCSKEFVVLREDTTVIWPLPQIQAQEEIPEEVRKALIEAKTAHAVRADIASLLAARTALIRMQRREKCSKINELADQGKITRLLADQANEVRLWANAMGHDEVAPDAPSRDDVEQLLEFMDLLFDTLYVQPEKLRIVRERRVKPSAS